MRQRKVKDLEAKMQAVRAFLVEEPSPEVWDRVFSGGDLLPDTDPAHAGSKGPASRDPAHAGEGVSRRSRFLEIGCGKGDFLLQLALQHPENDYIGIEGQASVVLRAMEKAVRIGSGEAEEEDPPWMRPGGMASGGVASDGSAAGRLPNVRFVCAFVNGMRELFLPGSLAGIYLNFSDPWPKTRHAKRRLTWRGRLRDYAGALGPGGFIAVKTDNDALFDFTLEEIAACGWTPAEMTRDLHGPGGITDTDHEARCVMTEYERKFHQAGKAIHYVKIIV